jgi:hypothetical protein
VPDHRTVLAGAFEYAPAARRRFGEQLRVRLSAGVMLREGLASAAVIAPGLLIRYQVQFVPLVLVIAMEDVLAFLPTERAGGLTLDRKVEHSFLALLGLELRL